MGTATVVSLILLPLLVGGLALWSLNAPAQSLDTVTAAIVNNDEPVTIDGQQTPVGRALAGNLVDQPTDNYTWVLTDSDDAEQGLAGGSYVAVVTIPQSFSRDVTSVADPDPDQATKASLSVQTSPASGFLDPAVSRAITDAATVAFSQELGQNYLEKYYAGMNTIQDGFVQAADGADQVADGAARTEDGAEVLSSGADTLAVGLVELDEATGALAAGADEVAAGSQLLAAGTAALGAGSAELAAAVDRLDVGANDVAEGATGLAAATVDLARATGVLDRALTALAEASTRVGARAAGLAAEATGTADSAALLAIEAATLESDAAAVESAAQVLAVGQNAQAQVLENLASTCPRTSPDLIVYCDQVAAASAAADTLAADADGVATDAGALAALAAALDSDSDQLSADTADVARTARRLATAVTALDKGVDAAATGAGEVHRGAEELSAAAEALRLGADALAAGTGAVDAGTRELAAASEDTANGASRLGTAAGDVAAATGQLDDATASAAGGGVQLAQGSEQLAEGAGQVAAGAEQLGDQLSQGAQQVPTYTSDESAHLSAVVVDPIVVITNGDPGRVPASPASDSLLALAVTIALWLGAAFVFLFVSAVSASVLTSAEGSFRLTIQALAPAAAVVMAQSVVTMLLLGVLVGQSPVRLIGLLLVGLFVAVCFAAVNQMLVALFGGFGRILAAVVLTLTAATSLLSTSPDALRSLSSALPTGAALDAVRAVALGTTGLSGGLLVMLAWTALALVLSAVATAGARSTSAARVLEPEFARGPA